MRAGLVVVGIAIGGIVAIAPRTGAAANDAPHELGMEETVSSGFAYSSTFHFATTFAFDAAVRWRRWKLGGFAQYAVGTYGDATSFGAKFGPTIDVGPFALDIAPTFGWHRYFDVGAVHWPSDVATSPCRGYDGVDGSSLFVGLGLDLHRPPMPGANFFWAISAFWSHDLHRTHVVESGGAVCEPTRGFGVPVDATIGGEQLGFALRFGLDVG